MFVYFVLEIPIITNITERQICFQEIYGKFNCKYGIKSSDFMQTN